MTLVLLLAGLAHGGDPPPCATLVPPAEREPVPEFAALTGRRDQDVLDRAELVGRISVINAWYEY